MSKLYPLIVFLLALLFTPHSAFATHNRAGEITIEQVFDCDGPDGGLTVRAKITTYTKASSVRADRDTLTICWGDGICERVPRDNGPGNPPQGELLDNDTKRNFYIATHTYPARGQYTISMQDPNRNGGILNVNFPNSDQIKFYLETIYTIPNPQFQGCNDTPVLLQPPIDIGCVGQVFTHNPNAYDPNGDSLSYHLTVPLMDEDQPVPNYVWPDQISPGPNNRLNIDPRTGEIVWDAPQEPGEYNLAMIIVEYRNGFPIDTILRDMQILIEECDNRPPVVETSIDEICVIAGELVEIDVTATAPLFEVEQQVRLTALGGPFEVPYSPATFEPDNNFFQEDPVNKVFRWQTACEHIGDQFYSVVFKATDDFFGDSTGLATLKTVRIKVVGPPPEAVDAESSRDTIRITWDQPYFCEEAEDQYFRGFTVWRREGQNPFPIDECLPGLEGRGYEKLTEDPIIQFEEGRYFFLDTNVERGRTYCYRILAEFARITPVGQLAYNIVESLPSEEICIQLNRDIPLITNVDVLSTDNAAGEMRVCWSKPLANEENLDTIRFPGPYLYELQRAPGMNEPEAEYETVWTSPTYEFFADANDTCFVDTGLNTEGQPYTYRLRFYTSDDPIPLGTTRPASSVFLSISPSDNRNILSWDFDVPWINTQYVVYREASNGEFVLLDTVDQETTYTDFGLANGDRYCYRIESIGSYGVEGVVSPIINFSQKACGVPEDNIPPCAPVLEVSNICDELVSCADEEALFNTLRWRIEPETCEDPSDVVGYNVYYAPIEGADFSVIARFDEAGELTYEHKPEMGIAGCYAVTAVDSFQVNESAFSEIICVDNCPFYTLPNTFTPNGDGQNDTFRPFPYCFVESVDFQVFNRWGQLVYRTEDANINWTGVNLNGQELAEGVYYFTCRVFERRVSGIELSDQVITGYIELIRGGSR